MSDESEDLELTDSKAAAQKKPPPKKVRLYAKARRGKAVEWDLGFKNPPEQRRAKVVLPKHSGKHLIVFKLVPTAGLDIAFDRGDPIWVTEDERCPPPRGINTDQISVEECDDRELIICDLNEGKERSLTYQLNFVGEDAVPLDPEIRNGGTMITDR